MSVLTTLLKALPPSVLDNLISVSQNVLKRSSKVGRSVASATDGAAAAAIRRGDDFPASVAAGAAKSDAVALAKNGLPPANTLPPPSAGATARASAKNSTLAKYGITPTMVFAGVSATVLGSLALARLDATDGVRVSITDITILDENTVKITFTPSGSNFSPCVNDTFTFYPPPNPDATPTTPDLSIGGDKTVVKVLDNNTIVIRATLTQAGNSRFPVPPPPAPGATPSTPPTIANWGKMTCHSDYDNQLAQGIGEAVAFAAGAAAGALVETAGALTPAAAQILSAAAGGAATVLSAGADALEPVLDDIFGPIKEFFGQIKWFLLACCLLLISGGLTMMLVS